MYNFGLNLNCIVMTLKRFGVSLEDELLEQLDSFVKEDGYANRSQAIRFLIEKNLAEKKWQCNHIVAGTIFILYDQQRTDISARISDIQIRHRKLILSSQQQVLSRIRTGFQIIPSGCLPCGNQ